MSSPPQPVGFVGLGLMGTPIALNLARAGTPLLVWNRTHERVGPLVDAGAEAAADVDEVFRRCESVLVMLVDERATDEVLSRGGDRFARLVEGRTLVSLGTTSPAYAERLGSDIAAAGGRLVEAPVAGSRIPAENGQLVAMLGGDADAVADVMPLLAPACRALLDCGGPGAGLRMKLAVNLYLTTTMAALAEATHFAAAGRLDLGTFSEAIGLGQTASDLTRVKLPKLTSRDFAPQAAVSDAYTNTRLVLDEAAVSGIATPMLAQASGLFAETMQLGASRDDMAAVVRALERRSSRTDH
ncbi:NAD(P)-dependent oxidoreductase [Microbacterium sp. CPCC 204701]|uniref:NAD(P)-dependent oxidoreductase n=1 Tax=Microbacterium sp. CPCC 204701 TaxID=2493084 RepID=UPI000FD6BBF8|nr:NAD(P)-dependent oxidoreductase [Microbacterium sp. CPCC 204701]